MERNDGLRALLLRASVYQKAQDAIGGRRAARVIADEVVRSDTSKVVVDIGCGTGAIAETIDFATYVGFDPNPPYIAEATARFTTGVVRGAVAFVGAIGDPDLRSKLPDTADIVLMAGVLHHLDDDVAAEALALATQLVGTTGRFVAFDPGLVDGQPRVARMLARRDRGQNVRTVAQTKQLLSPHFALVDVRPRHDVLRIPYTHLVAEATNRAPLTR